MDGATDAFTLNHHQRYGQAQARIQQVPRTSRLHTAAKLHFPLTADILWLRLHALYHRIRAIPDYTRHEHICIHMYTHIEDIYSCT
jgi:hypothetical protein